jgi:hypothetical protein
LTENLLNGDRAYMREGEYHFLVIRHEKFKWLEQEDKYIYFLYILRKQNRINENGDVGVFNVLCHLQMFITFPYLMRSTQSILEEYVLEDEKIQEFLCEVMELVHAEFENDTFEELQKKFLKSGE